MNFPEWWLTASGMFFVLGSAAMIVMVVVLGFMVWALIELRTSVNRLTAKVEEISDKVNSVASTVQTVTTEVGTRANGITKMIDEHTGTAMGLVEKFAPLLVALATTLRLISSIRGRGRSRSA